MRRLLALGLLVGGCSQRAEIAIEYDLTGLTLAEVIRVETYVAVDPSDPRGFFADQPFRSVATGVGYEVRDFDASGKRRVLITHDAALGFVFTPKFVFTLLPPSGKAPPLVVSARAVGTSTMLARVDALPAKFAPGGRLAVTLSDMRCGGVACATDQMCCDDACTNVLDSVEHCGSCAGACGESGDSCAGGTCQCASGSACAGGMRCCPGVGCVEAENDPFNCGGCGRACNPGETCVAGSCKCNGGAACSAGGLCCAATGCSTIGSCPCGAQACNSPNTCCNAAAGTCVDLKSDEANCGACGNQCAPGLLCLNGACTCNGQICSQSDTCCSSGCANLQTSTTNCGTCGHACKTNETCAAGACKCGTNPGCAEGQSCCNGTCVNLSGDTMNCGICGKQCNPGERCLVGKCYCPGTQPVRACSPTETCCPVSGVLSGGCFDLTSHQYHCGRCDQSCMPNEQCISSDCVPTSCNPACTNGNMCDVQANQCRCNGSGGCGGDDFCCPSSGCTNRFTDPLNCNACGNNVTPDLCCGGERTLHDNLNCQSCGDVCACGKLCCQVEIGKFQCVNRDENNCKECGDNCRNSGLGSCCVCGDNAFCAEICPLGCPIGCGK